MNYDSEHIKKILNQKYGVGAIFNRFIDEVAPLLSSYTPGAGNVRIKKILNEQLGVFRNDLKEYFFTQSANAWEHSNKKNNELVEKFASFLTPEKLEAATARNIEALKAFQQRKVGGMNLSQRVWELSKETKKQLEFFLEADLATGRSAAGISRDLRAYLREPGKRFRRIRDPKTGKLKLSKPAKNYNPGRGVYRSSYKNAIRLARTEVNMAYRKSDYMRWQEMDFVTGIEVKLSGAHPTYDVCDPMAGKYPKDFKFYGWHPNCICYAVPITPEPKDFGSYLKGKKKLRKVTSIPKQSQNYVKDNTERFLGWKQYPYWLKDNFVFRNGEFVRK